MPTKFHDLPAAATAQLEHTGIKNTVAMTSTWHHQQTSTAVSKNVHCSRSCTRVLVVPIFPDSGSTQVYWMLPLFLQTLSDGTKNGDDRLAVALTVS